MSLSATISDHRLRYFFAFVWFANGLWCKVLGMVPRHEAIVGAILGEGWAPQLTVVIGIAEVGMAAWIISDWRYRTCAMVQAIIIAVMNLIEFALVPNLLLWGRWNLLFSMLLVVLILANAFMPRIVRHA